MLVHVHRLIRRMEEPNTFLCQLLILRSVFHFASCHIVQSAFQQPPLKHKHLLAIGCVYAANVPFVLHSFRGYSNHLHSQNASRYVQRENRATDKLFANMSYKAPPTAEAGEGSGDLLISPLTCSYFFMYKYIVTR